jgi:hypothetical protein
MQKIRSINIFLKNFIFLLLNTNYLKIYKIDSLMIFKIIFIYNFILYFFQNGIFYHFYLNKNNYYFFLNFLYEYLTKIFLYFFNYNFVTYKFFKFFIFVGLGFRKRIHPGIRKNHLFLYFGHRHWVIFILPKELAFFYVLRRRSLVIFSKTKSLIQLFASNFKSFCRENAFKIKGFMDIRTKRK